MVRTTLRQSFQLHVPELDPISLRFEPHAVPPSQSYIVVEYQVLAEGQEVGG